MAENLLAVALVALTFLSSCATLTTQEPIRATIIERGTARKFDGDLLYWIRIQYREHHADGTEGAEVNSPAIWVPASVYNRYVGAAEVCLSPAFRSMQIRPCPD